MKKESAPSLDKKKEEEKSVFKPRKKWYGQYKPKGHLKEVDMESLCDYPDAEIRQGANEVKRRKGQLEKFEAEIVMMQKSPEQVEEVFAKWQSARIMLESSKEPKEEDVHGIYYAYSQACKLAGTMLQHNEVTFQRFFGQRRDAAEEKNTIEQMHQEIQLLKNSIEAKNVEKDDLLIEEQEFLGLIRVYLRIKPIQYTPGKTKLCCKSDKDNEKSLIVVKHRTNVADAKKEDQILTHHTFDGIFPHAFSQQQVFQVFEPAVRSAVIRKRLAIFGYGQTNAGKTYTIFELGQDSKAGIAVRAIRRMFEIIAQEEQKGWSYQVRIDAEEIAASGRRDLLKMCQFIGNEKKSAVVRNTEEALYVFEKAKANRSTSSTKNNDNSSRSHMLLNIYFDASKGDQKRNGLILFADLAGSEAYGSTEKSAETLFINSSLSELVDLFQSLIHGYKYRPKENSLSAILLQYLGKDTLTMMIANVTPLKENYDQTFSTVNFAKSLRDIRKKSTLTPPKDNHQDTSRTVNFSKSSRDILKK